MDIHSITRRNLLFGNALRKSDDCSEAETSFADDESGATAIEYSLIAALVGITMFNAVRRSGRRTQRSMNCTARTVRRAGRGRPPPGCAG
ncbi:MAG: Flp family type IVb pilin [Pseudomonadota bacterium]